MIDNYPPSYWGMSPPSDDPALEQCPICGHPDEAACDCPSCDWCGHHPCVCDLGDAEDMRAFLSGCGTPSPH